MSNPLSFPIKITNKADLIIYKQVSVRSILVSVLSLQLQYVESKEDWLKQIQLQYYISYKPLLHFEDNLYSTVIIGVFNTLKIISAALYGTSLLSVWENHSVSAHLVGPSDLREKVMESFDPNLNAYEEDYGRGDYNGDSERIDWDIPDIFILVLVEILGRAMVFVW